MSKIGLVLKLVELLASLAALWASRRERQAGRNEAILGQRELNDAAAKTAIDARGRQHDHDALPDGLRENDGFRRD